MKATVISMASPKGGSGKTVITATFASFLSSLGKRVLMVDTDAATNGLSLFYIKAVSEEARHVKEQAGGLFEGTDDDHPFHFIEVAPNLCLLPSTFEFQNTEKVDLSVFQSALQSLVLRYREEFDFIFLDAQAGSDAFAQVAISEEVSDQVVIVSEYDPMSAAGVERLKALFPDSLTYRRTWVLLNKMLPEFIKTFSSFMDVMKYLSPLPWNADVVRAYARRALPLDTEVGNEYTLAVVQTLRSLLGEDIRNEMNQWLETQAAMLRDPVKVQLEAAQMELNALQENDRKVHGQWKLGIIAGLATGDLMLITGLVFYLIVSRITPGPVVAFVFGLVVINVLLFMIRVIDPPFSAFFSSYSSHVRHQEMREVEERVTKLKELSELSAEDIVFRNRQERFPS